MTIIGFAKNVAVVIQSLELDECQLYVTETKRAIGLWLESVHIALADHKTDAVLIISYHMREPEATARGRSPEAHNSVRSNSAKYAGAVTDEQPAK